MRKLTTSLITLTLFASFTIGHSVTTAQAATERKGVSLLRASAQDKGLGWVCNGWHAHVTPSMDPAKVHRRVLWLIRCATDRWLPGGYAQMVAIAERESGPHTWPWAYNPSGSSGVFQIIPSTFSSWWSAFGERVRMARLAPSVFSARTNVLLSVWAADAYGLGAWGA